MHGLRLSRASRFRGFNPRPTRRPGDAGIRPDEMRRIDPFQSTPDQKAGRCAPTQPNYDADRIVSIHARPEGRAMPYTGSGINVLYSMFQSTPDQKAGRCAVMFGDTPRIVVVSIHARPEGRAMPNDHMAGCARVRRFNPRPTRRPGDATAGPMRRWPSWSFNPRPTRRPGDAAIAASRSARAICFNPRPTRRPGDASMKLITFAVKYRFNPRPTRRPGDARLEFPRCYARVVSIHARPEGRAMPSATPSRTRVWRVSIHARPEGRAMPA